MVRRRGERVSFEVGYMGMQVCHLGGEKGHLGEHIIKFVRESF